MIFLNDPTERVNIDGVEMTVDEIKEAIIDSRQYQKVLRELGGDAQ